MQNNVYFVFVIINITIYTACIDKVPDRTEIHSSIIKGIIKLAIKSILLDH